MKNVKLIDHPTVKLDSLVHNEFASWIHMSLDQFRRLFGSIGKMRMGTWLGVAYVFVDCLKRRVSVIAARLCTALQGAGWDPEFMTQDIILDSQDTQSVGKEASDDMIIERGGIDMIMEANDMSLEKLMSCHLPKEKSIYGYTRESINRREYCN
ncbi:Uncharacterized protein Rs2_18778 [Raphanus sativus]|nr:Uncharacterized protein Rs2_18778 [Raphanus sativus]